MEKKYYSIKEVSEMLNLPASTLRFWEKSIPMLAPGKTNGGRRSYEQKDIDLLNEIKYLIDEKHLTLAGVNERLVSSKKTTDEKRLKAIQTLESIRGELMAIRRELNALEAVANELIIDGDNFVSEEQSNL
jgi:DNA-binding transcriptional MerR regulator